MAKFNLPTDRLLFIRGGLVSFKAGLVETTDEDAIAALSGALGVEPVEDPEPEKPTRGKRS